MWIHVCLDCVCQGLCVHKCSESQCVRTLVCWVVCVLVHVRDVCVQSSLCEHVMFGYVCVWPVLPGRLVSLDSEDLGTPAVSLNIAWGKEEYRSRERQVSV